MSSKTRFGGVDKGRLVVWVSLGMAAVCALLMLLPTWGMAFGQPDGSLYRVYVSWVSPALVGYAQIFPVLSAAALIVATVFLVRHRRSRPAPLVIPVAFAAMAALALIGHFWLGGLAGPSWLVIVCGIAAVLITSSRWGR